VQNITHNELSGSKLQSQENWSFVFLCSGSAQTFESAALSSCTIYVADWLTVQTGWWQKGFSQKRAIAKVAAALMVGLQGKTFGKAANGVIRNYLCAREFLSQGWCCWPI
jgi:hypothetical protein